MQRPIEPVVGGYVLLLAPCHRAGPDGAKGNKILLKDAACCFVCSKAKVKVLIVAFLKSFGRLFEQVCLRAAVAPEEVNFTRSASTLLTSRRERTLYNSTYFGHLSDTCSIRFLDDVLRVKDSLVAYLVYFPCFPPLSPISVC